MIEVIFIVMVDEAVELNPLKVGRHQSGFRGRRQKSQ